MLQSVLSVLKSSFVVVSAAVLLACDGGSSDVVRLADETTISEKPDLKLNVNVVKGPIAGAKVDFYKVDLESGAFGDLARATDYFFDVLYGLGVRYEDGALQFTNLTDAEVYSALSQIAYEDQFVGRIHKLKNDVDAADSVEDAVEDLDSFIAAETNSFHKDAVSEIKTVYANLADIKNRVEQIPTLLGELDRALEDNSNKISFDRVESIARTFSGLETDVSKNAGWSEFYNELDALKIASLSKAQVASRIDQLFDKAEENGWFVSDLVARKQLAELEVRVDQASDIFDVKTLIEDAYIYEGNEALKAELLILRDDTVTPLDAIELLKRKESLVKWPFTVLVSSYSTTVDLFAQFVADFRGRFSGDLDDAMISPINDLSTGEPENLIASRKTSTNTSTGAVDLDGYEGLVYISADISEGYDINFGGSPPISKLYGLFNTSAVRGVGNNSAEDQTVKYFLDGELLRFDSGELVTNLSDPRLTAGQRSRYGSATAVYPTRSLSVLSTLAFDSAKYGYYAEDAWISRTKLSGQEAVEDFNDNVYASISSSASIIASIFSGEDFSFSSGLLNSSAIYTQESFLESRLQADIVGARLLNEIVASFVDALSVLTKSSFQEAMERLANDIVDKEVDGKLFDIELVEKALQPLVFPLINRDAFSFDMVGAASSIANTIFVMKDELDQILPKQKVSDVNVSASDFQVGFIKGGIDSDGDGVFDNSDAYPEDPTKSSIEISNSYRGLTSIDLSSIEQLTTGFNGEINANIRLEQTFEQCDPSPCLGLGDLATNVTDTWVVVEKPVGSNPVVAGSSSGVGFDFTANVAGTYTIFGYFATNEIPANTLANKITITVPDLSSYSYRVPGSFTPGASIEVELLSDDLLCSVYPVCNSSSGEWLPLSSFNGDLYTDWRDPQGEGVNKLQTKNSSSYVIEYGQSYDLSVVGLGGYSSLTVARFLAGGDGDSDNDGISNQVDFVAGDAACSTSDSSFELLSGGSSGSANFTGLNVRRYCGESFVNDVSNALESFDLPSIGVDIYLSAALSQAIIRDQSTEAFSSVKIPANSLNALDGEEMLPDFIISSNDRKKAYFVYASGRIDVYDFNTQTLSELQPPVTGYKVLSVPEVVGEFLFVQLISDDATGDQTLILDKNGAITTFGVGSNYLAPGQKVELYIGGSRLTQDSRFVASWTVKRQIRKESGGGYNDVVVELSELATLNSGRVLSESQLQLNDVVEVTLKSLADNVLLRKTIPVLDVSEIRLLPSFPEPGEGVSLDFSEKLALLSGHLFVVWEVNGIDSEYYQIKSSSLTWPYQLSSGVTQAGDGIRATVKFRLDDESDSTKNVELDLIELEALAIGSFGEVVPRLLGSPIVTGARIEAEIDRSAPADQYLRDYFAPIWFVDGDPLIVDGQFYTGDSIDISIPYGSVLEVAYAYDDNGNLEPNTPVFVAEPELVLNDAKIVFDEEYAAPEGFVSVEEVLSAEIFNDYVPVWNINGVRAPLTNLPRIATSIYSVGDTLSFELYDRDATAPDSIGLNKASDVPIAVIGYGYSESTDEDFDNDGVRNSEDYFIYDPACSVADQGIPDDFDRDGLANLEELDVANKAVKSYMRSADSDQDGLLDDEEQALIDDLSNSYADRSLFSLFEADSDGDENSDYYEVRLRGSDPTDGNDSVDFNDPDPLKRDLDQDGILDVDEYALGTNPNVVDTDQDGLEDGYEYNVLGTDPLSKDSDDDGLSDAVEILITKTEARSGQANNTDFDGDGLTDGFEVHNNYDPRSDDTNKDGVLDGAELSNATVALINLGDLADYRYREGFSPIPQGTCYASWLYNNRPEIIALSEDAQATKVAFADQELSQVYLMDATNGAYLEPIPNILLNGTVTSLAFAAEPGSEDSLYVGFDDGSVREYDLSGATPIFVDAFKLVSGDRVTALLDQGSYLIVETKQDEASFTQYFYDKSLEVLEPLTISGTVSIKNGVWDDTASKNKLWVVEEGSSAGFSAFFYENPYSDSAQETPQNLNVDGLELQGPLLVDNSQSVKRIRFGSGHVYLPSTGQFLSSAAESELKFTHALQIGSPELHTVTANFQQQLEIERIPDPNTPSDFWSYTRDGFVKNPIALVASQEDAALLSAYGDSSSPSKGYIRFTRFQVGDSDSDGVPGWYEAYAGFDDSDAGDAALMLGGQSFLDSFNSYRDISKYLVDSDGDGLSDGREADELASALAGYTVDTDKDGLSDQQELEYSNPSHPTSPCPLDPENANSNDPINNIADGAEDCDADGLTNAEELYVWGTNIVDSDSDGDSVSDGFELRVLKTDPNKSSSKDFDLDGNLDQDGSSDFDGDGLTNAEEEFYSTNPYVADTDGDGLSDSEEVNGAVTSNPNSADTDNDGLSDLIEVRNGFDPRDDSDVDDSVDTDSDRLPDWEELIYGSDISNPDTDGDGLEDYDEVKPVHVSGEPFYTTDPNDSDTDGDSLSDEEERLGYNFSESVICLPDTVPTPLGLIKTRGDMADTDLDGLTDSTELGLFGWEYVSNPVNPDSDGDGVSDEDEFEYVFTYTLDDFLRLGFDVFDPPNSSMDPLLCDTDGDGLTDEFEKANLSNAGFADTDNDLLSDSEEFSRRTIASNADTDNDGLRDGYEVFLTKTDPLSKDSDLNNVLDAYEDPDGDGMNNLVELETVYSLPLDSDTGGLINNSGKLFSEFVVDGELLNRVWINNLSTIVTDGSLDANGDVLDSSGFSVPFFQDQDVLAVKGNGVLDGDEDFDRDGFSNSMELLLGTDPWRQDTDNDGISDSAEVNGDPQNITCGSSGVKVACTSDPLNSDTDDDGLLDGLESVEQSNPNIPDTDDDGLIDGEEIRVGTSPITRDTDNDFLIDGIDVNPLDVDGDADGIFDFVEFLLASDPSTDDSDGDLLEDGLELWVFGYDQYGALVHFGNDADNDGIGETVLNSKAGEPGWVPSQRSDFIDNVSRFEINSFEGLEAPGLTNLYVWYLSLPSEQDSDGDGLSDFHELMQIENDVVGGALDLDQGVDLSDNTSFESMKSEVRFVVSNPLNFDTNNNAVSDGDEDYDNDYASNFVEVALSDVDVVVPDSDEGLSDSDDLLDGVELFVLGTRANQRDTDGDGVLDGDELATVYLPADQTDENTNPRKVLSVQACSPIEISLEVAGESYCFDVQYISYPTLADSDYDGTGDDPDYYPLDPGCATQSQGFDRADRNQCFSTWMSQQELGAKLASIDSGTKQLAFFNGDWDSVVRYNLTTDEYLKELDVSAEAADFVEYELLSDKMILLDRAGNLRSVDLSAPSVINALAPIDLSLGSSVEAMLAVDNHVVVQIDTGTQAELALYDVNGVLVQKIAAPNINLDYALWDSSSNPKRLYLPLGAGLVEEIGFLELETASPGSNGFISAAIQLATAPFAPVPFSNISLDEIDDKVIIPSGYVFSKDLDVFSDLSNASNLDASYRPSARQMLIKQSVLSGRTHQKYYVSSYLGAGNDQSSSELFDQNSVQVFVDSRATDPVNRPDDPVRANSFDFAPRSENEGVWGLISLGDDVVQVQRNDDGIEISKVGLGDEDSDGMPCFYERRFDLVDNASCGALSLSSDITRFEDADGDKLVNVEEYDLLTNPRIEDSDGDGWSDYDEVLEGTDPTDPASF